MKDAWPNPNYWYSDQQSREIHEDFDKKRSAEENNM
jgi:hypothetical protein